MKPGIKVGGERRGIKKVKFTRSVMMKSVEAGLFATPDAKRYKNGSITCHY